MRVSTFISIQKHKRLRVYTNAYMNTNIYLNTHKITCIHTCVYHYLYFFVFTEDIVHTVYQRLCLFIYT